MSTTTQPSRTALLTMSAPSTPFYGTSTLLRLALRRSRVRITAWAVGSALLNASVASSWDRLYPTTEERLALAASLSGDPTLSSILGPLFDPTSTGGLTAWRVGSGSTIALSLAATFLVVRHSRADEAEGRTELVLGAPIGRAAPLTAALLAASTMLGLFAVVSALALSAMGLGVVGSIAFAATVAAASLVFAGVAAVATQMARTSRAANGIAGATAGLAFLITAVGNGQSGDSFLPWLTPFGWMQQTRAYAGERWWLIALSLVVAAGLALAALHVESRRDVGDGLLAQRRGRAHASSWISGPVALAWRLDRGYLVGWAIGFAVLGAFEGSLLDTSADLVSKNPSLVELLQRLAGGVTDIRDLFLVTMTGLFGIIAAAYGVSAALRLRSEEEDGRAETVLTTAIGRTTWLAGHGSTALVGSVLLLAVGGLSLGLVYGATSGDIAGQALRGLGAALVSAPATVLVAAVPLALVGVLPRWASVVSWLVIVWCLLAGYFGAVIGLPDWLQQTSPFGHLPLWPAQPLTLAPLLVLTLGTVALVLVAVAGISRRDMPR